MHDLVAKADLRPGSVQADLSRCHEHAIEQIEQCHAGEGMQCGPLTGDETRKNGEEGSSNVGFSVINSSGASMRSAAMDHAFVAFVNDKEEGEAHVHVWGH